MWPSEWLEVGRVAHGAHQEGGLKDRNKNSLFQTEAELRDCVKGQYELNKEFFKL